MIYINRTHIFKIGFYGLFHILLTYNDLNDGQHVKKKLINTRDFQ